MNNRKRLVSILAVVLAAVMLLGLLAGILPTAAHAASSSEIMDQIDQLEAESAEVEARIMELEGQIQENLNDMMDQVNQKKNIDQQIALLYSQITILNEQISAYSVEIADKQEELDDKEARYAELSEKNRERVRAMEEDGNLSYWSVLFKANSFADLLDRLNMIEEINASDQRRLQELDEAAKAVEIAKEELAQDKANAEAKRVELAEKEADLEEKRAQADALLAELLAKGDEYEEYMAQSEAEQDRLMQEIANMYDEYDRAKEAEYWATYTAPVVTAPPENSGGSDESSSSGGSSSEGWVSPVYGYTITSSFGMRVHPVTGVYKLHTGIDIPATTGTPIRAAESGQVITASYQGAYGNCVIIDHGNGYSTLYGHQSSIAVSVGDTVTRGQTIGYVGSTGYSTGPHLHFEIRVNGSPQDPLNYTSPS